MSEDSKAYIGPDWYFDHDAGTTDLNIGHDTDGVDYLRLNSGGPVEVLNANLNLNSNKLVDVEDIKFNDGDGDGSNWRLNTKFDDSNIYFQHGTTEYLRLNSGGPIEVLNAELQIGSSSKNIKFDWDNASLKTSGSGTGYIQLWDDANTRSLLKAHEGGPIEIENSHLRMSSNLNLKWQNQGMTNDVQDPFISNKGSTGTSTTEIVAEDGAGNQTQLT